MSKECYEIEGASAYSQAMQLQQDLILVSTLGLKPERDGNMWCVQWGDAPESVAGFGETPQSAVLDFNHNYFHEKFKIPPNREIFPGTVDALTKIMKAG